jgi:hypothetical protein
VGKGNWRVTVAKVGKVGLGLIAGHQGHPKACQTTYSREPFNGDRMSLPCFAVVGDWRLRVWLTVPQSALRFLNKPLSGVTLWRVYGIPRRLRVEGRPYSGAGRSRIMAGHEWGGPCVSVGRPSVTMRMRTIPRPARAGQYEVRKGLIGERWNVWRLGAIPAMS